MEQPSGETKTTMQVLLGAKRNATAAAERALGRFDALVARFDAAFQK